MVFMQYGGLLSVRNRRVSILQSNPLWGPRRNLAVPIGMVATMLIAIVNLYGSGFHKVFLTAPIPGLFWGIPFAFALGILCMDETRKLIVRTYPKVRAVVVLHACMSHRCYFASPSSHRSLGNVGQVLPALSV
jgi:sodium/potassium-transporting ATPase subunit alpha